MALTWHSACMATVLVLFWVTPWSLVQSASAPENEVPLRPTRWLPEGKMTTVTLPAGRTRRLFFTLRKTPDFAVTVSPCGPPMEWTLAARTLKDKPLKSLEWSSKKSMPEVWWRGPGTEERIHSFSGNAADTYSGPAALHASVYILRLRSKQQSSRATVYLHQGPGTSGAIPQVPADPRVHTLGVGMTSVTLSWAPSASFTGLAQKSYEYCVLVNSGRNFPSVCAALESSKMEEDKKRTEKKKRVTAWPILKEWWWEQWEADSEAGGDLQCACRGTESVCTVSDLLPDTRYYFDVFAMDRLNGTSAAYTGTAARTHEEARPSVATLREGELRWVTFHDRGSATEQFFSFRPRGVQQSGLLTLQSCGGRDKVKVTVSSKGLVLTSQAVGEDLVQIWLQGSPVYVISLEREGTTAAKTSSVALPSVKMQTSSAYHRRGVPSLPSTLQVKSFNRLRGCNSVTLAWMGTEERSLYCVYKRKLEGDALTAPCLGPESRSDTERVLCKYFQELNPRRAVTTAVIGSLEPGTTYVFDVYLMRRWGIPIKYASKTVKTRKDC
ncbi:protein NDNF [Entelurus aequoreus]|uniref:protein NDNF n=1 Tax=Entelurus aequoreus TaxID=161455 RepID=UPI002B1E7E38|nr:protein NDNF [Entelurus aequoreus]XP_061913800.1 protein NDNF [Entelurus aequoreus]XP_061913801.1 protein NDNF [Entelurus aequoreus]